MLKYFEIRDVSTYCPVRAIKCKSDDKAENYLLRRAGFNGEIEVMLLSTLQSRLKPRAWHGEWFQKVHEYIIQHFDELKSGQVIDMEHVRGERDKPRTSDRPDEPMVGERYGQ